MGRKSLKPLPATYPYPPLHGLLTYPPLRHPVKLYRFSAISMRCKTNPEIGSRFHRFLSRSLVWGGWVKKLPYLRRGRINTITRLYLIFNPYWNAVGVTKVITIGRRIRQTEQSFLLEHVGFERRAFDRILRPQWPHFSFSAFSNGIQRHGKDPMLWHAKVPTNSKYY